MVVKPRRDKLNGPAGLTLMVRFASVERIDRRSVSHRSAAHERVREDFGRHREVPHSRRCMGSVGRCFFFGERAAFLPVPSQPQVEKD
jgi:hypothetical protein